MALSIFDSAFFIFVESASFADAEQPPAVPQFESFLVDDDGMVEISGSAGGFSHVELIHGAVVLDNVDVSTEGLFRIRPADRLKPGEYRFVLRSTDKEGRSATSFQTLLASIPEHRGGKALALVEEPGKACRLISKPGAWQPNANSARQDFAVESIVYKNGKLVICGKKSAGMRISIISRNRIIGFEDASGEPGFCIARAYVMGPGDYIFRAELTDVSGSTRGVVSLPFSIVKTDGLTRQVYQAARPVDTVLVGEGDTLSHIAKRVYGNAALAAVLFEANQDRLRSPHQIYAGQELVLPLAADHKTVRNFHEY